MRLVVRTGAACFAACLAVALSSTICHAQGQSPAASPELANYARNIAADAAARGVDRVKLQPLTASISMQTTERGLNTLIIAIAHLAAECRGASPAELSALQARFLDPAPEAQGVEASRRLAGDAVNLMNRYDGRCIGG